VVGRQTFPVIGQWSDARLDLPARTKEFVADVVGPGSPWSFAEPAEPPASRLTPAECIDLAGGLDQIRTDAAARQSAAWGMSFLDLVRQRAQSIPDAVLVPSSASEVDRIIQWCVEHDVVIVPRGGGTSVVGGLSGPSDDRRWISVDLSSLNVMNPPDLINDVITVGPGVTGPALEAVLTRVGRVFGHFPQSWERATIGGYAATRSAGQNSTGYGRIEDLVVAANLVTPIGGWHVGHLPATSVGPNLLRYVLGSEGTLGVFTDLTLRIRPRPQVRRAEGAMAPNWGAGMSALRSLVQNDVAPSVIRLSDVAETRGTWRMSAPSGFAGGLIKGYLRARGAAQGCLLIMDWHGSSAMVEATRTEAWRLLRSHGVIPLGGAVGRTWVRHRFDGPYLRDQLVRDGYFVETFETSSSWDTLDTVHARVEEIVSTAAPRSYLMSHISHAYSTGASLYFTIIATGDLVNHWPNLKRDLTDALTTAGGTASHHHGMGLDHAPWLAAEVGSVGLQAIRAVKQTVDPSNIMNPAILAAAAR
jgi:alkyldihydroxyacetonephosphate synthase